MYDYHMHSSVSFDSQEKAEEMVKMALKKGLKEICFTDHLDYCKDENVPCMVFSFDEYKKAYDNLHADGLLIRKGMEFGLTPWNQNQLEEDLSKRDFDFVIGSVHFVNEVDPYEDENYWKGKTIKEAYWEYLEEIYKCLKVHNNFDVLGHITYVSKARVNPTKEPFKYEDYSEITDEILKLAVEKGKGIEVNTSGIDKTGDYLPPLKFVKRFVELGGEIITVGSDAHNKERVGQYIDKTLKLLKEICPYVCTFEKRKPIFHKL